MVSQQLLSALHTLVLHGLVKRSLWGPLVLALLLLVFL